MPQVVDKIVFIVPEAARHAAPVMPQPVQEVGAPAPSEWKPVDIDPNGVLPEDGGLATVAPVGGKPVIPVIRGRTGAKDPIRPGRLDNTVKPEAIIGGLKRVLEGYTGPAHGPAATARMMLAELVKGPHGRHDAEYEQRLRDAQVIAAHLLRDPQEASTYAVANARVL